MMLFQKAVFGLSRLSAYAAALVCALMLSHILLEIVLRTFFGLSTYLVDEFVGYGVGAMGFLALGYCLEKGALIRVNLLLGALPHGGQRALDILCGTLTLAAMSIPIWFFWVSVQRNFTRGIRSPTVAEIPMWIPESVLLFGMVLFWVQLLAFTLRAVTGAPSPAGEATIIDPT